MKPTPSHYIQMVIAGLTQGAIVLAVMEPELAHWCLMVAILLVAVLSPLGLASSSMLVPDPAILAAAKGQLPTPQAPAEPTASKAGQAGYVNTGVLGALAVVAVGAALSLSGCKWIKAEVPVVAQVVQVVEADVRAHDSLPQITQDVCASLGGDQATCLASAGTALLIQDALAILIDSGVLGAADRERAVGMRDGLVRAQPLATPAPLPSSR